MTGCCDRCARRSWLVGRLAGHIEKARGDRAVIRTLMALGDDELVAAVGGTRRAALMRELERLDTAAVLEGWKRSGVTTWCRHHVSYPGGLARLPDPPAAIHLVGDPVRLDALLAGPAAAIVGARRCSADGARIARSVGRGCSAAAVTVVSGMALGVDAAAHEGALEAGGSTVAVLAGGPDRPYPARWRALHGEIGSRGAVISELPPGTASFRWGFPARNRLIAALSQMVVVVEAAERSGSLITAEIAADLGIPVGAVPGSPDRALSRATNELIRDGSALIRDAGDILDELLGAGAYRPEPTGIEADLAEVAELVGRGLGSVAQIAGAMADGSGVPASLTRLELLGIVERRTGGQYVPGTTPWRAAAP